MAGRHPARHAGAHIAYEHGVAVVADIDAGRVEADADILPVAVELAVVEPRQHHVLHGVAGRGVRQQRAHQQPRKRGIAVGEVIDVGLPRVRPRRHAEAVEAGIAEVARVGRRHGVASEPEESERAPLKAVRRFLAAAAQPGQIIAVAGGLEDVAFLLDRPARERIARAVIERAQLHLALRRDWKRGDELVKRPGVARRSRDLVGSSRRGLARHQHVAPEGFARKEHAADEAERRIELAIEGTSRTDRSRPLVRAEALSPRRCTCVRGELIDSLPP